MENYYEHQLAKIDKSKTCSISISCEGGRTFWLDINDTSIEAVTEFLKDYMATKEIKEE